ncbi:S-layer homology domain-containing protein [Paenibacillus sp. DMB5]|uniref:S-layer homology domain-containing protein n=1 Tax=Paenibacillus sp. DMB5 TaxID=1780103 RepID=UPI00076D18E9|nr:S-layer homology domain-containing protein [Paenibacillus sp. DMB5]KUP26141.1 hypothetical protein AWJ19_02915 [Paenibacillus sp. DMB5]
MNKWTGRLTSSLLALLLLVPSPALGASGTVTDGNSAGQQAAAAPDYTGHWAAGDLQTWVDKGLLSGYGNGVFKPDQNITRAEWVALVNRVFNLQTVAAANSFSDVEQGKAYYSEVMKAVSAGYVSGYSDGTFHPQQIVSRQEAAVMLYRLFRLDAAAAGAGPQDAETLPEWSREAVLSLLGDGFLSGYEDGSFKGGRPVTRAEAVRMIGKLSGEIILQSGSYAQLQAKNLVISSAGVSLKDTEITGNLYLTEGIAGGDILLDNVKVAGKIIVSGGGENSVVLNNTSAASLTADKPDGKLRIVLKGSSSIPDVTAESGVRLEEDTALGGAGFSRVKLENTLPAGSRIQLSGSFDSVVVNAAGEPELVLVRGTIAEMTLNRMAHFVRRPEAKSGI